MKSYCTGFIISAILLTTSTVAQAGKSKYEKEGDVLQVLIPLTAYGATFYMQDIDGRNQFYKSFLTNLAITYSLKYTINEPRPEHNGNHSFPSGHTSAAFQGAAFIHLRYGWQYGLPAYAAAAFVGWSRVEGESDKHDTTDVLAGAAIGIFSGYYFTTPYKGVSITPYAEKNGLGVTLSMDW